MGIKDLGSRWPLYLRKKRTTTDGIGGWSSGQRSPLGSGGTLKKTLYEFVSMKVAKQIARTSAGLWTIKDWTLWRGQPPLKQKKRPHTE
jgi:hypothetical protein